MYEPNPTIAMRLRLSQIPSPQRIDRRYLCIATDVTDPIVLMCDEVPVPVGLLIFLHIPASHNAVLACSRQVPRAV